MATNPSLVSVETAGGRFQQTVRVGNHVFLADEPESLGAISLAGRENTQISS